jgi:hypothetical protein
VVAAAEAAEIPPWPGEADEASFLSEGRVRGDELLIAAAPPPAEEAGAAPDLPPLDELVARIPAEVREALDDLFRAKFVRVRRVIPTSLKS